MRGKRAVPALILPALLAAGGFLAVRFAWDPQPVGHSCPALAPPAECGYPVGLLGQSWLWLAVGALVGLALDALVIRLFASGRPGTR